MIVCSFNDGFGEQAPPVSVRSGGKPGRLPREVATRRNHTMVPYASTLRVRKLNGPRPKSATWPKNGFGFGPRAWARLAVFSCLPSYSERVNGADLVCAAQKLG